MTPEVLSNLQATLLRDAWAFLPEVILSTSIVLLLFIRLFSRFNNRHLGWVALVLCLNALYVAGGQWSGAAYYDPRPSGSADGAPLSIFSGMLVYDNFTIFLRLFLLSFTALVIGLCLMTGIPDREDSADFFVLLFGAVIGMSLMASANHLMMVFIGVEMASLPSYALAGFLKGRRQSSEASLKYVVYGGGAAGVMLYGISLIAGKFGTGFLPDVALGFAATPTDPLLILGGLFLFVGIAFKLAAVPFHFWCPDVFEGAAAEVAAFLSVASKGAALALLARIAIVIAGHPDAPAYLAVAHYLTPTIALIGILTATFGNLAAYSQTNLKRLLAYSTIAHAGYMMMALAPLTPGGAGAVLFYLVTYLVMNLGAFAIVAFMRNLTGSEDLSAYRGLIFKNPVLAVTLSIFLLSLLGVPPLAGFVAKFQVFAVLFDAGQDFSLMGETGLSTLMYCVLVAAGINTVISLIYYIKVLKVMIIERPVEVVEGGSPAPIPLPFVATVYASLLAGVIVILGVYWPNLDHASRVDGIKGLAPVATTR